MPSQEIQVCSLLKLCWRTLFFMVPRTFLSVTRRFENWLVLHFKVKVAKNDKWHSLPYFGYWRLKVFVELFKFSIFLTMWEHGPSRWCTEVYGYNSLSYRILASYTLFGVIMAFPEELLLSLSEKYLVCSSVSKRLLNYCCTTAAFKLLLKNLDFSSAWKFS